MEDQARDLLVAKLKEIGLQDHRNGYTELAEKVSLGVACSIDSWIVLDLLATQIKYLKENQI